MIRTGLDIIVDGKGYALTTLDQFRDLKGKINLKGVELTDSGAAKWRLNKATKPWLPENQYAGQA